MCPWVGPHAPSFGRQLWGLPSRSEYLSPQGVLFPRVYGTIASPLLLELRGLSAWQATPSWTVYRLACHRLLPWLRVTFAMVPDAALPGSDLRPWGTAPAAGPVGRLGRPSASDPWGVVCCFSSLGRPRCARVCGVHGPLALVHRCARPACSCVRCSWPLGACSPVRAPGVFCVQCPWPLGSCSLACPRFVLCVLCPWSLGSRSPVCPLGVLGRVCGVLGHLAPFHQCACLVCCVACAVSLATWLLFTGVPARCAVCAVSLATWLLFTGAPAQCVVLRVRCP